MLIIGILIATDKQNGPAPPGVVPLAIFFIILGIGAALGMETGFAINPARDFGPRILTAMVGYGKAGMHFELDISSVSLPPVFDFRNQYWLWCPILGPILGMQIGALAYDTFLYTGPESIVNKPYVLTNYVLHFTRQSFFFRLFLRDLEAERRHLGTCARKNAAVCTTGAEAV